jgi:hypothetical protein
LSDKIKKPRHNLVRIHPALGRAHSTDAQRAVSPGRAPCADGLTAARPCRTHGFEGENSEVLRASAWDGARCKLERWR